MNACLTSNGSLLNENIAWRLSQSGINVVNISIEGNRETNDFLREEGIFDKAVLALENLRKYKIESTIATTVSKYNYECLSLVLQLAKQKGATTVIFQPFSSIFLKDISKEKGFFIDQKDIKKAQEAIEDIIKLANEYKISTNPVSYLRKIPSYLNGKRILVQNGCRALWTSCPINSKGDIFPCWVVNDNDKIIGNISQESLFDLWFSKRHDRIRESVLKEGCPGCMMSCYDEVFGRNEQRKDLIRKIKKMKKVSSYKKLIDKLIQSLRSGVVKLRLRYRFYKAYRGSLYKVIKRIINNIYKRSQIRNIDGKEEIVVALLEINLAKEKIKKEISKYR